MEFLTTDFWNYLHFLLLVSIFILILKDRKKLNPEVENYLNQENEYAEYHLKNTKQIQKNNVNIKLTGIEFNLLQLLITNAGKNLSRIDILNNVWGYKPERAIDTRLVDLYIFRLRSKLKLNGQFPDYISTVRGIGYVFQKK